MPTASAIVKINKPFFEGLTSKEGYSVVREEEGNVVVDINCENRYPGDDETIVFEISNVLGVVPGNNPWTILWDESTY